MRLELKELISNFYQFIGVEKYSNQNENENKLGIRKELVEINQNGQIEDKLKTCINNILMKGQYNKREYVLTFEKFIKENFQKRPPNAPDYDDRPPQYEDDEEEE